MTTLERAQRERQIDILTAIETAAAELDRLRARMTVHPLQDEPYHVSFGRVNDEAGRFVCAAAGKGWGSHGHASLLFEAVEHFHLVAAAGRESAAGRGRAMTPLEIAAQPELRGELHLQRMASDFPQARIGCTQFESLRGPRSVWYPSVWKNPFFEITPTVGDDPSSYRHYLRYQSNNGSASGSSAEECLLHALLEEIERDAVSLFLIDSFLVRDPGPLRVIDLGSLPPDLRSLADHVAVRIGVPPILLEITTDIGVPVIAAIPSGPARFLGLFGAGASLSAAYAAERALGELLQCSLISDWEGMGPVREKRQRRLEPWPTLGLVYQLDRATILSRATVPVVLESAEEPAPGVASQLNATVVRLERAGLEPFAHVWTDEPAHATVLSVLIPGIETFSVAMAGEPVLPTGRGASGCMRST